MNKGQQFEGLNPFMNAEISVKIQILCKDSCRPNLSLVYKIEKPLGNLSRGMLNLALKSNTRLEKATQKVNIQIM